MVANLIVGDPGQEWTEGDILTNLISEINELSVSGLRNIDQWSYLKLQPIVFIIIGKVAGPSPSLKIEKLLNNSSG